VDNIIFDYSTVIAVH